MEVEGPGSHVPACLARLHQRALGKASGQVWMEDMLLAKMAKMQGVLRKLWVFEGHINSKTLEGDSNLECCNY